MLYTRQKFQLHGLLREAHALSKLYGLPILLENQNEATRRISLKMFREIVIVYDLDTIFS